MLFLSCPEPTPCEGLTLGDHCWPRADPWPDLLNTTEDNNHTYNAKRTSLNCIRK